MFKKILAKLMSFGEEMSAKPESTQEKFQREQTRESELAEERRRVNLKRMAERGQKEEEAIDNTAGDTKGNLN